jgi:hypothetical protein
MTSSEQARADAMADAATLEFALRGIYYRDDLTQVSQARAAERGQTAIVYASAGLDLYARDAAREAAREAVLAVPGLRG